MSNYWYRVTWTAIPRGFYPADDGTTTVHVVAFATPQLFTDHPSGKGMLTSWGDDWANWPGTVDDLNLEVAIAVNGVVYPNPGTAVDIVDMNDPALADPTEVKRRSDLWKRMFPDDTTLVRSFVPAPPSLGTKEVHSAPAAQLRNFAKDAFGAVLTGPNPVNHPPAPFVAGQIGDAAMPSQAIRNRLSDELLRPSYEAQRFVPPSVNSVPAAFVQHAEFLNGFNQRDPESPDPAHPGLGIKHPTPTETPERDFHEVISHTGHYRDLVRLLGLAVDLKVVIHSDALWSLTPPDPCRVRIFPLGPRFHDQNPDGSPVNIRPITVGTFSPNLFLAESRPVRPLLSLGRLPMHDASRFEAIEVDHDSAAIKLRMLAENLERSGKAGDPSAHEPLPSLRSPGLSVAMTGDPNDASKRPLAGEVVQQIDRGLALSNAMGNATPFDPGNPSAPNEGEGILLFAEDLLRGFRYDVFDSLTGAWHSLMAREGVFRYQPVNDTPFVSIPSQDEAIAPIVPTQKSNDFQDDDSLHQQQTLFHWTGWSLGAHRPGHAIGPHYDPSDDTVIPQSIEPSAAFPVYLDPPEGYDRALFPGWQVVRGTLPRLRFGRGYAFRGRAADLAGDSVDFGNPTPTEQAEFLASLPTQPVAYGRFEPINAPPLAFEDDATPGEAIERLVIRSNYNDPPAHTANPHDPTCERHVLPPITSVGMVERTGVLDLPTFPHVDQEKYQVLASRDGAIIPGASSDPDDRRGLPLHTDTLLVNYVADPLARGVTFVGLPGTTDPYLLRFQSDDPSFPDGFDWIDPRPLRLIVSEPVSGQGPAPTLVPSDDKLERQLIVYLDKADIVKVRMSSHFQVVPTGQAAENPDLLKMGQFQWLDTDGRKAIAPLAQAGLVWVFTPFKVITLVHAVRQPLATPEFLSGFGESRFFGDTFVTLLGTMSFSRKSTGRMDLHASWPDPVDDAVPSHRPTQPGDFLPGADLPVPVTTAKLNIPLDDGHDFAATLSVSERFELHDHKHKAITYVGEATTAFTEYFTKSTDVVVDSDSSNNTFTLSTHPLVPGSVHVRDAVTQYLTTGDDPLVIVDEDASTVRVAELPDTSPRIPPGTRLHIDFVEKPISRFSATPLDIRAPASKRPSRPVVDRVLPTFGWTSNTIFNINPPFNRSLTSTKTGSSLRVYLQRPWWSSGAGEKLGVVLYPGGVFGEATDVPEDLVPYVTQWGADPTVIAPDVPSPLPSYDSFPAAVAHDAGLFLDELPHVASKPDRKVAVAVHEVAFDEDQNLWYCDIDVDAGHAYMPFVRLALARYQPFALQRPDDTLNLSRIVLADIMQTVAGRTASVTWAQQSRDVGVTLTGQAYTENNAGDGPGKATVQVQERLATIPDEDLGWVTHSTHAMDIIRPFAAPPYWSVHFRLPKTPATAIQPYRLVIDQFDHYFHQNADQNNEPRVKRVERLMHTDIVNL
jgi:hypothetical protein